jgi:hypothetical protein
LFNLRREGAQISIAPLAQVRGKNSPMIVWLKWFVSPLLFLLVVIQGFPSAMTNPPINPKYAINAGVAADSAGVVFWKAMAVQPEPAGELQTQQQSTAR